MIIQEHTILIFIELENLKNIPVVNRIIYKWDYIIFVEVGIFNLINL
jgi:hypothetical protein